MKGQSREQVREFTLTAVGMGIVLAIVFCAANAYLGLKAGMTVSASIPAAVVSMGLFKVIRRRRKESSLLESNLVQTITSTGETLAGGIIFTVPALVMTQVWTGFDYWTVTLIAMTGGVLGILFMIPLRRVLIADPTSELTYPEGVACAEVLKSGEQGGSRVAYVAGAIGVGALFKLLTSGVRVIQGSVEGALRVGQGGLYLGCDLSPALLGVGYIVGLNVSSLMFAGGAIAWLIGIPILLSLGPPIEGDHVGPLEHQDSLHRCRRHGRRGALVYRRDPSWDRPRGARSGGTISRRFERRPRAPHRARHRRPCDSGPLGKRGVNRFLGLSICHRLYASEPGGYRVDGSDGILFCRRLVLHRRLGRELEHPRVGDDDLYVVAGCIRASYVWLRGH